MSVVVAASGEKGQGRGRPTYLRIRYMRRENEVEEGESFLPCPTREKLAKIPLPPLPPLLLDRPFLSSPSPCCVWPVPPPPVLSLAQYTH